MSPILGIIASQVPGKISSASFESIATTTVGVGGSSTITFSSIPQTYKHLQVRGIFIPTSTDFSGVFRLNGDANSSSYIAHSLQNATGDNSISQSPSSLRMLYTQDSTNSLTPAGFILDILDYTNTNKFKTTRTFAGIDSNTVANGSRVNLASGLWMSTSAVNSVTLYSATGGYGNTTGSTFARYSHFALYGIKG